jgi:deoxyadenosine/deoxycytidine kinase
MAKLVSIEGNIGSGKSTILKFLKSLKSDNIVFVDEPVNKWKEIVVDGKNALEHFYDDIPKNAFWFQVLAYITRLKDLIQVIDNNPNKIIICERSIYTDKMIFAKMLYSSGHISKIEWATYCYWFDTFKEKSRPDIILYVNTEPKECMNRIVKRNREEEVGKINLKYLQMCHQHHQDWLCDDMSDINIININGHQSIENIQKFMTDTLNNLF